jgi:hypothetical protein
MRTIAGRICLLLVIAAVSGAAQAEETSLKEIALDSDALYEVTYQVTDTESRTIKPVRALEIIQLGSREFLMIEPTSTPQPTQGFVALDRISAILPVRLGGVAIIPPERPRMPSPTDSR